MNMHEIHETKHSPLPQPFEWLDQYYSNQRDILVAHQRFSVFPEVVKQLRTRDGIVLADHPAVSHMAARLSNGVSPHHVVFDQGRAWYPGYTSAYDDSVDDAWRELIMKRRLGSEQRKVVNESLQDIAGLMVINEIKQARNMGIPSNVENLFLELYQTGEEQVSATKSSIVHDTWNRIKRVMKVFVIKGAGSADETPYIDEDILAQILFNPEDSDIKYTTRNMVMGVLGRVPLEKLGSMGTAVGIFTGNVQRHMGSMVSTGVLQVPHKIVTKPRPVSPPPELLEHSPFLKRVLDDLDQELDNVSGYLLRYPTARIGKFFMLWGHRLQNNDPYYQDTETLGFMHDYINHDRIEYGQSDMITTAVGLSRDDIAFICEAVGIDHELLQSAETVCEAADLFEQTLLSRFASALGVDDAQKESQLMIEQQFTHHFGSKRGEAILSMLGLNQESLQTKKFRTSARGMVEEPDEVSDFSELQEPDEFEDENL